LILQNIEEDYGMFVWPCIAILAEYVWQQRSRFSGSSVVEVPLIFMLTTEARPP
jgi:methyltransferase-like protein 23